MYAVLRNIFGADVILASALIVVGAHVNRQTGRRFDLKIRGRMEIIREIADHFQTAVRLRFFGQSDIIAHSPVFEKRRRTLEEVIPRRQRLLRLGIVSET